MKALTKLLCILLVFFSVNLVFAIEGCCLSEGICKEGVEKEFCPTGSDFSVGKCEVTSFCKKGCCMNEETGSCDSNSIKSTCEENGGDWSTDYNCNLPQCQLGCCNLGDSAFFGTQRECEIYFDTFGFGSSDDLFWDNSISEAQCILNVEIELEGACITEVEGKKNSCIYTTNKNCFALTGSLEGFFQGVLCTSPELNTSCEKTENTLCFEDKVYFLDSCGNKANIYDSKRINDQNYWNKLVNQEDACGNEQGNGGSASCGNCNRILGGICALAKPDNFKVDYGENYCKQTNCVVDGEEYKNGESWCVYESKVGEGDDIPGSTHWIYSCVDGEIKVESCGQERSKVCIQQDTTELDGETISFRKASCKVNQWSTCLNLNEELSEESKTSCTENPFCFLESVNIQNFNLEFCVPQYPKGFSLSITDKNKKEDKEEICSIATQTCTVIYEKDWDTDYHCKTNCQCETEEFTKQMNELCTSLGDCGASVNLAGDFSDSGYEVSRAPRLGNVSITKAIQSSLQLNIHTKLTKKLGISNSQDTAIKNSIMSALWGVHFDMRILPGYITAVDKLGLDSGIGEVFMDIINPSQFIARTVFGIGDTKKKYVTFTCEPWQPSIGGKNCTLCNQDSNKPCSEYTCSSLGTACQIINKGETDEMCESIPYESIFPQIVMGEAPLGLEFIKNSVGYSIKSSEGTCLQPYTDYTLSFSSDEPAQCKYTTSSELAHRTYWENNMSFFGTNSFTYSHEMTLVLPDPSHGQSQGLEIAEDFQIYILCQDVHGNMIPIPYEIETCVNEGKDITPPRIMKILPSESFLLGYNSTEVEIELYTNELAECKWSTIENQDYNAMHHLLECEQDIELRRLYGYKCNTTLPITSLENNFYFKCRDQPWLENIEERATNTEDQAITLKKVSTPIKIDNLVPSEDHETDTKFKYIELGVQTSGGGNTHTCDYFIESFGSWTEMYETGKNVHKQPGIPLETGTHTIKVKCKDETGDSITSQTTFKIIEDSREPLISRIIQTGNSVNLLTTEDAVCKYSMEKCNFDWYSGSSIGSEENHLLQMEVGKKYYIKCKDEWENSPGNYSCSLVLGG